MWWRALRHALAASVLGWDEGRSDHAPTHTEHVCKQRAVVVRCEPWRQSKPHALGLLWRSRLSFSHMTIHTSCDVISFPMTKGDPKTLFPCADARARAAQVITQEKSRRTVEYAFGFAYLNNRRKVTAIHKANIMKLSDGLFLKVRAPQTTGTALRFQRVCLFDLSCCYGQHGASHQYCKLRYARTAMYKHSYMLWLSSQCLPGALQEFREVAKLYPMIQAQEMIVDNTCMQLVGKPNQFDVMVRSTMLWCRVGRHVSACAGRSSACEGASTLKVYEKYTSVISSETSCAAV